MPAESSRGSGSALDDPPAIRRHFSLSRVETASFVPLRKTGIRCRHVGGGEFRRRPCIERGPHLSLQKRTAVLCRWTGFSRSTRWRGSLRRSSERPPTAQDENPRSALPAVTWTACAAALPCGTARVTRCDVRRATCDVETADVGQPPPSASPHRDPIDPGGRPHGSDDHHTPRASVEEAPLDIGSRSFVHAATKWR